jgi:hypothetical protein
MRRLLTVVLLLTVACGSTPTALPPPASPTPDSAQATIQAAVIATATALAVNVGATLPSIVTATPAAALPAEAIAIQQPAPGSAVASPLLISGLADPAFEQTLVIRITAEAGQPLTTVPTIIAADVGQRGPFEAEVQFSVPADQPGRVSVYTTSARDGGIEHLSSVEVTLLASGPPTVLITEPRAEAFIVNAPQPFETFRGGVLRFSGQSEHVFENQLGVMLCGEGGSGDPDAICGTADNVLARGVVSVRSPDTGQPGPFDGELAYSVSAPTRARLALFITSPRDGGLTHVVTRMVVLEP